LNDGWFAITPTFWLLHGSGRFNSNPFEQRRHFWLTGEPRNRDNPTWQKNGSLPGSTAIMLWRPDGIDVAVIFRGRDDKVSHEDIHADLDKVIERLK
jgi:hypothetical protein